MFKKETYTLRREELRRRIGNGVIVIPGNNEASRNYFDNAYSFRQDSTFLYFAGLQNAGMVVVLDCNSGIDTLYGDDLTVDDIIWTGSQPTVAELGATVGIGSTAPLAAVRTTLTDALRKGRKVHFIYPYRQDNVLAVANWTGIKPTQLINHQSVEMIIAVAEMRETKSDEEIEELERAFEIGYTMHTTAMQMCHAGTKERDIAGTIEGVAHRMGDGVSFHSIVSQHGETLHNHSHDGVLEQGRLLLCDAGGETVNNYCSDHTRTIPVGGRFTAKQLEIYQIVLAAHDHILDIARPGRYTDLHNASYRVICDGLADAGLLNGTGEQAYEAGIGGLFMPHGLGHGLGMDVHDCEAMGERGLPDFEAVKSCSDRIDTCIIRANWILRPGTVMSDEPGIYFVPALIEKWRRERLDKGLVNYAKLESYYNFGGIRLEDDMLITATGCRRIGRDKMIPITPEQIDRAVNG